MDIAGPTVVATYYEVRWAPESYWPGVRLATRADAEAVVDALRRRHPNGGLDAVEVHVVTVHAGTPDDLAEFAISDGLWAEMGFCDSCPTWRLDGVHSRADDDDDASDPNDDPDDYAPAPVQAQPGRVLPLGHEFRPLGASPLSRLVCAVSWCTEPEVAHWTQVQASGLPL